MKTPQPPLWLERTLRSLLSPRDRDTISGDLHEAYCEEKLPQLGRRRADLWYAGQVVSFAPHRFAAVSVPRPALALICLFTALSGTWLGAMDLYLKHPGYAGREIIAGTIVGQALLTLIALHQQRSRALRVAALCGCAAILWLAGRVALGIFRGAQIEGYILLIALALTVQALLTVIGWSQGPEQATPSN